jgi:hypothetical protein
MKQTRLVKIMAAGMACALALSTVFAQQETTTTTTTAGSAGVSTSTSTLSSAGTITAYTPGSDYISFRTTTDTAPVRYYYTKKTTILDPEGNTVTWSAVRPDMPATVWYVKEGDRMVVSKVVLSKPAPAAVIEKKETTTTTTTQP